jgi:hypothetical protein
MKHDPPHGVGPLRTGGRGGSTDLFPIGGSSRQERPDPHFAPTQTSFDVRGASCFASPFSRVFLTYRIRSLSSTFLYRISVVL